MRVAPLRTIRQEFQSLAIEPVAVGVSQQLAVDLDAAQGLLQVVASGKRELLKVLVGAPKVVLDAFLIVDIGAGAEPFHDVSVSIANRKGAPDEPPPAMLLPVPETILDVVGCP